jgi:hypothetical protein
MRAIAGPVVALVIAGGFLLHRACTPQTSPGLEFTDLELAGADADNTGTCYSLATVLIANNIFGNAPRTWTRVDDDTWKLLLERIETGPDGNYRWFNEFTFHKVGTQVRLTAFDAAKGVEKDLKKNIDELLFAPNERKSTPVDRCAAEGSTGYLYVPKKKA